MTHNLFADQLAIVSSLVSRKRACNPEPGTGPQSDGSPFLLGHRATSPASSNLALTPFSPSARASSCQ
eukprot:182785-Pyramimonas_sp.AAC.1